MHWSAFAWPLGTFLLTALFKPRTPEEFDRMREAGWPLFVLNLMRFVAAAGVDGSKLASILSDLAKRPELSAVEEQLSKLPADVRASLPPLQSPRRISSKGFPAVKL